MSDFVQGVVITVVGMGMVFAVLGLLMLIMVGLERILQPRPAQPPAAPLARPLPPVAADAVSQETVAAIAVALAMWQARQRAPAPPETTVVTFVPSSPAWRALTRLPGSFR